MVCVLEQIRLCGAVTSVCTHLMDATSGCVPNFAPWNSTSPPLGDCTFQGRRLGLLSPQKLGATPGALGRPSRLLEGMLAQETGTDPLFWGFRGEVSGSAWGLDLITPFFFLFKMKSCKIIHSGTKWKSQCNHQQTQGLGGVNVVLGMSHLSQKANIGSTSSPPTLRLRGLQPDECAPKVLLQAQRTGSVR